MHRGACRARRLQLDAGLDALADSDSDSWHERAQLAAALSTPLGLDAADRAWRGGLPAAPARPLEPGAYELHITGLDAAMLALACPNLHVTRAGDRGLAALLAERSGSSGASELGTGLERQPDGDAVAASRAGSGCEASVEECRALAHPDQ